MSAPSPDRLTTLAIVAVTLALALLLVLRLRDPTPAHHVGPGFHVGGKR